MMFERFTIGARRVVVLAEEEARRLNHNHIGTEHILLGLIGEEQGNAAKILGSLGVSPDALRSRVVNIVGRGDEPQTGPLRFSPRAMKVLELSLREAIDLGDDHIGTVHILLGLVREGDGVAAKVFVEFKVDLQGVRSLVRSATPFTGATGAEGADGDVGIGLRGLLVNSTKRASPWDETLEGRDYREDIARVEAILSRRETNNAVILAEPGVDATAFVLALARKFRDAPRNARFRELYELAFDGTVVDSDEVAQRDLLNKIGMAATEGCAFFVPDFLGLALDGSSVLAAGLRERLKGGELQIVTVLTEDEYRKTIRNIADLDGLFDTVALTPPTLSDTLAWLRATRDKYEAHHKISITDSALTAAATIADTYLDDGDVYARARGLIDRAGARLRTAQSSRTPELRELDERIATLRVDKEHAIDDHDFELAASFRDQEKEAIVERIEQEKLWKSGELNSPGVTVVDEDTVLEIAVELTGVSETRLRASVTNRRPASAVPVPTIGRYRILNDRPITGAAKDLLGTIATARRLATILNASRDAAPFILAVDGGWGVGKSSLLRLIEAELTDERIIPVQFNAWTAQGDLALESLVKSVLVELDPRVLRRSVRKLARQRHVSLIARIVASIGARLLGANRLIDQFWAQAGASDELRNDLRKSIGGLLEEWVNTDAEGGVKRSLVVFVDDLDRCSEETVVRMCEAMKLYLDAPGLIFVLACDLSVLADGVSASTGLSERAGRAYLEKIIQVTHRLPPPSGDDIRHLIAAYAEESNTTDLFDPIIVEILADQTGRNPRRIKRILNSFVLTTHLDPTWHTYPLDPTHALTASLLQHIYPQIYEFIVSESSGEDPIGAFLDFAAVKRRATDIPREDDPWWRIASRVFRRAGLSFPHGKPGSDLSAQVILVERTLPREFAEYARNEELLKLLRGIGNVDARVALRAQLVRGPFRAESPSE